MQVLDRSFVGARFGTCVGGACLLATITELCRRQPVGASIETTRTVTIPGSGLVQLFSHKAVRDLALEFLILVCGLCSLPPCADAQTATGTSYYVSPKSSRGSGTIDSPFGLPDLLTPELKIGVAFRSLHPGDTLYFRGGDYHFSVPFVANAGDNQILYPENSGTVSAPITLRSYTGEIANLILDGDAGQPLLGTCVPTRNYIRFLGLKVTNNSVHDFGLPYGTNSPAAIRMSGTGNEVGYCELVGATVTTGDVHAGIYVVDAYGAWIHHNDIHDVIGATGNSTGILVYHGGHLLVEDNYFHDNTSGVSDKDGGKNGDGFHVSIYRRNYITGDIRVPSNVAFSGNIQGNRSVFYVYDNVFDSTFNIRTQNQNSQVYNNLFSRIKGETGHGAVGMGMGHSGATLLYGLSYWNNIVFTPGRTFDAVATNYVPLVATGPNATFSLFDYNVYTGTPWYEFPDNVSYNWSTFKSFGYERHTRVVSGPRDVYDDLKSYRLKARWQTAGRYGDAIGPRFSIKTIKGASRYGPRALRSGSEPTVTQQPRSQSVPYGGRVAFDVEVANSSVISYQWQRSRDHGATWVNALVPSSAALTVPKVARADHGALFRCLVNCVGGSATSRPATLTVTAAAPLSTKP
jgi:hypothetical protein